MSNLGSKCFSDFLMSKGRDHAKNIYVKCHSSFTNTIDL